MRLARYSNITQNVAFDLPGSQLESWLIFSVIIVTIETDNFYPKTNKTNKYI